MRRILQASTASPLCLFVPRPGYRPVPSESLSLAPQVSVTSLYMVSSALLFPYSTYHNSNGVFITHPPIFTVTYTSPASPSGRQAPWERGPCLLRLVFCIQTGPDFQRAHSIHRPSE